MARIFPVSSSSAFTSLDRIVENISDNKKKIPTRKIVVYGFTDMSGRLKPEGRLVAERLTTKLAQTGEFQVIERSRLEDALKEINMQASGILDERTAMRAGRMLGAEAAVTGTIARVNGTYEINARAINVATGEIITGAIVNLHEEELLVREDYAPVTYTVSERQSRPQVRPQPAAPAAPPKGWENWPGWNYQYGSYRFENGKLYYYLTPRQHDGLDAPVNGYYPGVLLAKPFEGENWSIEMKARYDTHGGGGRWLSFYIWLGDGKARPSLSSPRAVFVVGGCRNTDPGSGDYDHFRVYYTPEGKNFTLNPDITMLKIERKKNIFKVFTRSEGGTYREAFSTVASGAATAETQKIVFGGQAYGFSSPESYVEYEYVKLNGKPIF